MKKMLFIATFFVVGGISSHIEAVSFKNNSGMEDENLQVAWYVAGAEGQAPQVIRGNPGTLDGSDMPIAAIGFAIQNSKGRQLSRQMALIPRIERYELACGSPSIFSKEDDMQWCVIEVRPMQ